MSDVEDRVRNLEEDMRIVKSRQEREEEVHQTVMGDIQDIKKQLACISKQIAEAKGFGSAIRYVWAIIASVFVGIVISIWQFIKDGP